MLAMVSERLIKTLFIAAEQVLLHTWTQTGTQRGSFLPLGLNGRKKKKLSKKSKENISRNETLPPDLLIRRHM